MLSAYLSKEFDLEVLSMISDFIFHGHLHGTCRGKAPTSANADRSVA